MRFPFIPYNDGCATAQFKRPRTMQTCLTQILGTEFVDDIADYFLNSDNFIF